MSKRLVSALVFTFVLLSGCTSTTVEAAPEEAVEASPVAESEEATEAPPTSEQTPTSTTSTTSSAEPPGSEPPLPCARLLDGAERVHPSDKNVVADFDGDDLDDEIFWLAEDDSFDGAIQVIRSSDGAVSEPLSIWSGGFDGVLAASDLDADSKDEVFYSLGGNTALTGVILELDECELRQVSLGSAENNHVFSYDGALQYTYFAGGNGCAPSGCHYRVACQEGPTGVIEIVFTSVYPETSVLSVDFDEDAIVGLAQDEHEVVFGQSTVTIAGGQASITSTREESTALLGEIDEWVLRPEIDCS